MHEVHHLGALGQRQGFDLIDDLVSRHAGNDGALGADGKPADDSAPTIVQENQIRSTAYAHNVCIMTTITGAQAAVNGIRALQRERVGVKPIQQYRGNVTVE